MAKSTAAETELRVQTVYQMLIDGYSRYMIIQYGSKTWRITDRAIDDYIASAKHLINEFAKETKEQFYNKAKNRFERLYRMALEKKDYRGAQGIIATANSVLGYDKINLEHSGNLTDISEEEYKSLLEKHLSEYLKGKKDA